MMPLLQLQDVSVVTEVGQRYLLRDVSFEVGVGDRLAIVGASGSGKTTLLRLLNRLSDPTHGTIFFQGQPLNQHPVLELRRQVLLVLQEPKLLGMTVEEALTYPLRVRQLAPPIIQERLLTGQQRFGIPPDWLPRTELQLSVGQRQIISLARACLCEPQVLLLDEPTSALDPGRVEQVAQILHQRPGTLILASHQLSFLERCCTHLLWLENGSPRQTVPIAEVNWQHIKHTLEQQAQTAVDDWGA
jgi:D-methionine transport system ATP-binding protein